MDDDARVRVPQPARSVHLSSETLRDSLPSCLRGTLSQDVKQADQGPGAGELAALEQRRNLSKRNPLDHPRFLAFLRFPYEGCATAHENFMRRIHHADHGLIGDDVLKVLRSPASLFLDLTRSSDG